MPARPRKRVLIPYFCLLVGIMCALAVVGGNVVGAQKEPSDLAGAVTSAEEVQAGGTEGGENSPASFWQIVRASGVIGLVIFALSVAGTALAIEHALSIRRSVLIPPGLVDEVRSAFAAGQVTRLAQGAELGKSALGRVVAAGLSELEFGWPSAEKAMEEALAEEAARLYRKVEYLSVIGNLAPMLGLLGTVVGMIVAFREVAQTQGAARAADLAEGIYLALVTTVEGLLVAIPALAAFAFFRNKVDALVAEVGLTAERLFMPARRQFMASTSAAGRAAAGVMRTPKSS